MDLTAYKQIIKETMEAVAFADPQSAASKAEAKIKQYLDENTAIPDDKKAELYANFMQQIVVTTINQAIQAALQLPVQEKQAAVLESEVQVNAQKIASMQAEDAARKNEVAAKVARAKYEIEQLLPSQVALNQKEVEIKQRQVEIAQKELAIKGEEVALARAKTELLKAQVNAEKAKIEVEKRHNELLLRQVQVEERKIPLMEAEAELQKQKAKLTEKQVAMADKEMALKEQEVELTKKKVEVETQQANLVMWQTMVKQQEVKTVGASLRVNAEIEKCKCETNLKIAQIQAESL